MTVGTGQELLAIDNWIFDTVSTDSVLTKLGVGAGQVHEGFAPMNLPYPLIVFNYVSGQDTPVFGGPGRMITRALYQVRAIFESVTTKQIMPVCNRLDYLMSTDPIEWEVTLNDKTTWAANIASFRDRPYSLVENNQGKRILHKGGFYWVDCQLTEIVVGLKAGSGIGAVVDLALS